MDLDHLHWALRWKKGLIFLVVAALLALLATRFGDSAAYAFHLRVPLFFALLIFSFPLLAMGPAASMFRNLFVQPYWQQLSIITASAIVASMAVAVTFDSIYDNAPARFGLDSFGGMGLVAQVIMVIVLSAPTIWVAYQCSKGCQDGEISTLGLVDVKLGIGVGVAVGIMLMGLVFSFYESRTFSEFVEVLVLWLIQDQPGYIGDNGGLQQSHANATGFALIGLVLYVLGGLILKPWHRVGCVQIPAILYLNIIATFSCLLLAGATFFFDYFYIPVFVSFLIFSAAAYRFFAVDHFYEVFEDVSRHKPATPADFDSILKARLAHQGDEKTMVVVCCSGGGIQAGAWAAQVLTGLQAELSDSFGKAITLISSVSGGSVGSLFYLDRFNAQGFLPSNEFSAVFNGASKDGLNAVGWGLAYPDLLRFLGMPWLPPVEMDRGTVIEEDWKTGLKNYQSKNPVDVALFSNWRAKILAGKLPIPAFNATIVDNGKRFIISPVCFDHPDSYQCVDFSLAYKHADMHAVSAARLSATFPYVSPIARNTPVAGVNAPNYHVADGGFFDNFGVFTSLEWLRNHVIGLKSKQFNLKNIMFIEIHAFPDEPVSPGAANTLASGWKTALFGPLTVLANARGSTQTARNQLEVAVLKKEFADAGVHLEPIIIAFPKIQAPYDQDKAYEPPLSWKLSPEEKQAIANAWKQIASDSDGPVSDIKALWKRWKL